MKKTHFCKSQTKMSFISLCLLCASLHKCTNGFYCVFFYFNLPWSALMNHVTFKITWAKCMCGNQVMLQNHFLQQFRLCGQGKMAVLLCTFAITLLHGKSQENDPHSIVMTTSFLLLDTNPQKISEIVFLFITQWLHHNYTHCQAIPRLVWQKRLQFHLNLSHWNERKQKRWAGKNCCNQENKAVLIYEKVRLDKMTLLSVLMLHCHWC